MKLNKKNIILLLPLLTLPLICSCNFIISLVYYPGGITPGPGPTPDPDPDPEPEPQILTKEEAREWISEHQSPAKNISTFVASWDFSETTDEAWNDTRGMNPKVTAYNNFLAIINEVGKARFTGITEKTGEETFDGATEIQNPTLTSYSLLSFDTYTSYTGTFTFILYKNQLSMSRDDTASSHFCDSYIIDSEGYKIESKSIFVDMSSGPSGNLTGYTCCKYNL